MYPPEELNIFNDYVSVLLLITNKGKRFPDTPILSSFDTSRFFVSGVLDDANQCIVTQLIFP